MEDRWLSVDEITEYLGVSRDTIYNWISQKGLPAHRVGRLWKFKKEEVDGWVRQGGAADSDTGQTPARAAREPGRG
jgi:excisionase family DNA binding protein